MEKQMRQLIIKALEGKGYEVTEETDGIYVNEEDTSTGVKISVEVIP